MTVMQDKKKGFRITNHVRYIILNTFYYTEEHDKTTLYNFKGR